MKHCLSILALCLLPACLGSGSGTSNSGVTTPPPAGGPIVPPLPPAPPANNSFASMLNNVRLNNGASPVTYDARLGQAAQGHANDMLRNNYFSHTGLNGSTPGDRIRAAGYNWRTYGENIAQGYQGEAQVLEGWTNSPGHHANNINPNFEEFGLAKAGSGSQRRWVLVLATEQ